MLNRLRHPGAIASAKARSWFELLQELDRDPGGRPYRCCWENSGPGLGTQSDVFGGQSGGAIHELSPPSHVPHALEEGTIGPLEERRKGRRISLCVPSHMPAGRFDFRRERSTVDAIMRVRSLSEQAVSRGGVALAISLDIINAFNSLPWGAIREGLIQHEDPPCLRGVIGDYLRDRYIVYMDQDGRRNRREIKSGRTRELAELEKEVVLAKIRGLGLEIVPNKTQELWCHRLPRTREPPDSHVRVSGHDVTVGRNIKYLGLTLGSHWGFEEHFDRLVPRIETIAGAMHRLLPNLEGPTEEGRRLYARVLRRISFEAATVLARFPPLDVLAEMDARVYDRVRTHRWDGGCEPDRVLEAVGRQERRGVLATWRAKLSNERYARR
ncbi:uncharacterized protein [Battus philenor]|uniref:uncharacterized protein n=1 Tax=Battus philenor TaxID=42288 RepID=UPI0035D0340D